MAKMHIERQLEDLTFPCERLQSDAPVKSYKVCNFLGVGEKLHQCNFTAELVRKSAHMQNLECLIVYHTIPFVSKKATLSLATKTICAILL